MRKMLLIATSTLLLFGQLLAQNRTITGKITDDKGAALPNASISVKGTNIGTVSGTEGMFSLSVPSRAKILVVSSIGLG